MRKINVYNLSIYNLGNGSAECFFWDETKGDKGSNEIASCLMKYLLGVCAKKTIRKIVMFSDACGGQNRNKYIAAMCHYLVNYMNTLTEINHIFMVTGHSHMEVDSVHSMVEKFSRNVKVFIPSEWEVVACMACKDSYAVTSMEHEEIKDMKELFKFLEIKNVTLTTDKKKMYWKMEGGKSEYLIHWIRYEKGLQTIQVKSDYKIDDSFMNINLRGEATADSGKTTDKTRRTRKQQVVPLPDVFKFNFRPSNVSGTAVLKSKYDDLTKLCKKLVIPKRYHSWYQALKH